MWPCDLRPLSATGERNRSPHSMPLCSAGKSGLQKVPPGSRVGGTAPGCLGGLGQRCQAVVRVARQGMAIGWAERCGFEEKTQRLSRVGLARRIRQVGQCDKPCVSLLASHALAKEKPRQACDHRQHLASDEGPSRPLSPICMFWDMSLGTCVCERLKPRPPPSNRQLHGAPRILPCSSMASSFRWSSNLCGRILRSHPRTVLPSCVCSHGMLGSFGVPTSWRCRPVGLLLLQAFRRLADAKA